ncbi:conserved hypothetical protein [Parafrankia sp. Ea1.12]|nr:conserved hypothetical protein [Parafrankia sp. Ea1.12]
MADKSWLTLAGRKLADIARMTDIARTRVSRIDAPPPDPEPADRPAWIDRPHRHRRSTRP